MFGTVFIVIVVIALANLSTKFFGIMPWIFAVSFVSSIIFFVIYDISEWQSKWALSFALCWFIFAFFLDLKLILHGRNTFVGHIRRYNDFERPFDIENNYVLAVVKLYIDILLIFIVVIQLMGTSDL